MYGDLFASFTQGFSEDHLATLQCDYIEALMQSCLVSIRQHCNVTFLQPFYKVFREAYGNVARKPVCNTNAKLQKGFPAWLPLSLYAMKMQPYGKKLQPFRNLNFPLGLAHTNEKVGLIERVSHLFHKSNVQWVNIYHPCFHSLQ